MTATVKVPLTGGAEFYLNGQPENFNLVPLTNGKATLTLTNYNLATGKNTATAEYLYDPKYDVSTSAQVALVGNEGDFTVGTSNPNVSLSAGQTATECLVISWIEGLKRTVVLSCATSSPTVACSLNPSSINLDPYGKQSAAGGTIYATGRSPSQKQTVSITASDAGIVHTLSFSVTIE